MKPPAAEIENGIPRRAMRVLSHQGERHACKDQRGVVKASKRAEEQKHDDCEADRHNDQQSSSRGREVLKLTTPRRDSPPERAAPSPQSVGSATLSNCMGMNGKVPSLRNASGPAIFLRIFKVPQHKSTVR
jgi:hypothetical protein